MITRFRTWCNELNTSNPTDAEVLTFLQDGYNDLAGRVPFYVVDDSASIVPVANTQDYAVPLACIGDPIYVKWGGRMLPKSDMDTWRTQNDRWEEVPASLPKEYAIYGGTLIFNPKPNQTATVTLRYVSAPPTLTSGASPPPGLRTIDQILPVYFAAALWCATPLGPFQAPVTDFFKLYEAGVERMKVNYTMMDVNR
jgi:hypothetical protein